MKYFCLLLLRPVVAQGHDGWMYGNTRIRSNFHCATSFYSENPPGNRSTPCCSLSPCAAAAAAADAVIQKAWRRRTEAPAPPHAIPRHRGWTRTARRDNGAAGRRTLRQHGGDISELFAPVASINRRDRQRDVTYEHHFTQVSKKHQKHPWNK